jgi:hypothetical protein
MVERTIRETNVAMYLRGYWVAGQRFRLSTGSTGWNVMTWSDHEPIIEYWVTKRRFYKAWISRVGSRTFDLEIVYEVVEVDPKRKKIALEAIRHWESKENKVACFITIPNPA